MIVNYNFAYAGPAMAIRRPKIAPCIFGIHAIPGDQKLLLHFRHTDHPWS
jgi:hypothetical protein